MPQRKKDAPRQIGTNWREEVKPKMKNNSHLILERATAYTLLGTPEKLETLVPLLDPKMFLEEKTWAFLSTGRELCRSGQYSKNTLCSSVEQAGMSNPHDHYSLLASAVTSSTDLDTHYPAWIERGRQVYIEKSERDIPEGASSSEIISRKREILERASALGTVDTGNTMAECARMALSTMDRMRSTAGEGIIQTGFETMDRYLLGMMPGTLTVVGARPSRGKTSLACQLALKAQSASQPVLFVSAEMPSEKVALKLAGMTTKTNTFQFIAPHLLSETEFATAKHSIKSSASLNIRILHKTDLASIEAAILAMSPAPKLVVFDYLQILPTPKRYEGMRADYLSEVVRSFSHLAVRVNTAFLLLSQVGRAGERGGASNADLKGSGGIEEAADAIILIEKEDDPETGADSLKRVLRLSKNRYGWGDDIECPVLFDPRTQTFSDWDLVQAQRIAKILGLA
jgi:KaiC/GvpD/RAD55 family RecA-like ATPase